MTTTSTKPAAALARLLLRQRGILLAPPLLPLQQQCMAATALAWVGGEATRQGRCRCSSNSGGSEPDTQQHQHCHQAQQQQQHCHQAQQQQQQQQQLPPGWRTNTARWPSGGLPAWQLQRGAHSSSPADTGTSSSQQQPDATTAGAARAGAEQDEDEVYLDDELQLDEGEEPLPAGLVSRGASLAADPDLGGHGGFQLDGAGGGGGGEDSADEFEVILDAFEEFDEGFAWEDEEGVEDELPPRGREEGQAETRA